MNFISHSTLDKSAALDLQQRLRDHGYVCEQHFLDSDQRSGIKLGEKWEKVIYDNLRDCRALLVLCSPNWLQSKWCFAELAAAKMSGKQIFPIVLEDCDRSSLSEYQAVFISHADTTVREEAFERLFQDLETRCLGPKDHLPWPNRELKDANGQIDDCPFPGLPAFDERYAAVYFGRERETQVVLEELRQMRTKGEPRLLMIVGGSGSGKSSLLMAGVLPRLKHTTSGADWLVLPTLRFGRRDYPDALFESLAEEIVARYPPDAAAKGVVVPNRKTLRDQFAADDAAQAAKAFLDAARDLTFACGCKDATVLLPVDQFEEFLPPSGGANGTKFLKFLEQVCQHRNDRLLVIGTMRSDYLDVYERQPHALKAPTFHPWRLEPFPRAQIENVIVKPAARAHVEVTPELLEQLKQETPTTDALPLLAFTLEKLYRAHAADKKLDLTEYKSLGGMEGSIKHTAEQIMRANPLPPNVESAVRLSFVKHLAQVNDKGEFVRLTARWKVLDPAAYPILEEFVAQRLLIKSARDGEVTLEVAHEAIFRSWEQLKSWLGTSADILRWRRDVRRDRETSQANHQKWTGLTGPQRVIARDWPRKRRDELGTDEIRWIEWANFKVRGWWSMAVIVFVLVSGLGVLAWTQADEAKANSATAAFHVAKSLFAEEQIDDALLWWSNAYFYDRDPAWRTSICNLIGATAPRLHGTIPLDSPGNAVAFSPSGKMLIVGTGTGVVRLWDIGSGKIKTLQHEGAVVAVAFSPDGQTALTGSHDKTARLWNVETGEQTRKLDHDYAVMAVAFSSDGTRVLTGCSDPMNPGKGEARLWDIGSGKIKGLQHEGAVVAVAFSPDGQTALTGSHDKTARLWNVETGEQTRKLDHDYAVMAVAFGSDGKKVLTGSGDPLNPLSRKGEARLWDTGTGEFKAFKHQGAVVAVAFSPNNKTLLTGSADDTAQLWDAETGQAFGEPLKHTDAVVAVAFSQNGKTVITGSLDDTARIWDAKTGQPRGQPLRHDGGVMAVAFAPDGESVFTASDDWTARIWDVRAETILKHDGCVWAVAFSPDGKTVLTGSGDKCATLWDTDTAKQRRVLPHDGEVRAVAFSTDGTQLLTGSQDKTARLWAAATGEEPLRVLKHELAVLAVAFSPDGKTIVTGGGDVDNPSQHGDAQIWSINGQLLKTLPHDAAVWAVAFSPDGRTVVTGGFDRKTRLWDAEGNHLRDIDCFGAVMTVAFSKNSQKFITGDTGNTAHLWNSATGVRDTNATFRHSGDVLAAAFSSDGQTVLTGSWDTTARFWDLNKGVSRGAALDHEGYVWSVAFSPDGTRVLTGSDDNTARIWNVPPPALREHPDRLRLSVEVRTGKWLDAYGASQRLNTDEWLKRRKRLHEMGGPCDAPTWDEYNARNLKQNR